MHLVHRNSVLARPCDEAGGVPPGRIGGRNATRATPRGPGPGTACRALWGLGKMEVELTAGKEMVILEPSAFPLLEERRFYVHDMS